MKLNFIFGISSSESLKEKIARISLDDINFRRNICNSFNSIVRQILKIEDEDQCAPYLFDISEVYESEKNSHEENFEIQVEK